MLRNARIAITALALSFCPATFAADNKTAPQQAVQITQLGDRLRIELNGQLFTEYFYTNTPRPYFYPIIGPGNLPMTRNWPMRNSPGEEHDHPHHRSLWLGHLEVNGHDFWDELKTHGTIVHDGFTEIKSGKEMGIIKSKDKWVSAEGKTVCTDDRTFKVYAPANPELRMFDFEITIHASDGELTFGDNKDGMMAFRVAETMRLKGGGGHIVNSTGLRDESAWGKQADWCDYYGPVEGKTVGVAIFDNPQNPRHPTWWHVRDYGLFAANPFGKHHFENLPDATAGNLKVPAGQSVAFRYRFILHSGDEQEGRVGELYKAYVKTFSAKQ